MSEEASPFDAPRITTIEQMEAFAEIAYLPDDQKLARLKEDLARIAKEGVGKRGHDDAVAALEYLEAIPPGGER